MSLHIDRAKQMTTWRLMQLNCESSFRIACTNIEPIVQLFRYLQSFKLFVPTMRIVTSKLLSHLHISRITYPTFFRSESLYRLRKKRKDHIKWIARSSKPKTRQMASFRILLSSQLHAECTLKLFYYFDEVQKCISSRDIGPLRGPCLGKQHQDSRHVFDSAPYWGVLWRLVGYKQHLRLKVFHTAIMYL